MSILIEAHDAALVAAMQAHGLGQILTFNTGDFRRFEPQIRLLTPEQVLKDRQQELDK